MPKKDPNGQRNYSISSNLTDASMIQLEEAEGNSSTSYRSCRSCAKNCTTTRRQRLPLAPPPRLCAPNSSCKSLNPSLFASIYSPFSEEPSFTPQLKKTSPFFGGLKNLPFWSVSISNFLSRASHTQCKSWLIALYLFGLWTESRVD